MNIFENKFCQKIFYPFSLIYGAIIWMRNKSYDKKFFRSFKIENCTIISVGNISVGGTGKTPVINFLARYLSETGFKVVILSRGYRKKSKDTRIVSNGKEILISLEEAGDEPFLLARQLKGIPIVVEADRYKAALLIQQKFKPDVILLDDGFQHRRLMRDLDIVLVDASRGFGNGFLLPAGFLREPISSLRRADLIWFTRIDQSKNMEQLIGKVRQVSSKPILKSCHQPAEIIPALSEKRYDLSYLNQKRVFLFSGIGNPLAFEETIKKLGALVISHVKFSDHYQYTQKCLDKLIRQAQQSDTDLILTTEKDYIRIENLLKIESPIYYLTIGICISDAADQLKEIIISKIYKKSLKM
jgi:tetraacyldisaccharide 4'-kinase